jgi:hypothetical protein
MGIDNRYFSDVIEVVKNHLPSTVKNRKVLCLGYPDFLVDEQHLISMFNQEFVNNIPEDPMSDEVRGWHKSLLPRIFDPLWIFKHLGFDTVIFDLISHRGIETIVDLNEPISNTYFEQFDLVIDTGTLEHCFNVGQAFKNVCSTIKKGGIFITAAPISKLNHGYWNFGTNVHADGFTQNGFEILKTTYTCRSGVVEPELMTWKTVPTKTAVTTIAKRTVVTDWVWPTQGKYL